MSRPHNNNDYIDGGIIGISGIDGENNTKNHVAHTENNNDSSSNATDDYIASNNDKNENNKPIVVSIDYASEDYNSNSNDDNIIVASSSTVETESAKKRTMMKKKIKLSSNEDKNTEEVNPSSVKPKDEEEQKEEEEEEGGGGCNNKEVAVLVLPPNNKNAINGNININNSSSNTIVSRTNNNDDDNIRYSDNTSEEEQDNDGESNKNVAELPALSNNKDDFVIVKNDGSCSTIRALSTKLYPADTYSFLSLYGPIKNPGYFSYGLMVYLFQMTFLVLMVLSVTHPNWSSNGDPDNPGGDGGNGSIVKRLAEFIPTNVSPLVRATQITATLSYFIFADSTVLDVVTAVELFPRFKQATSDDKVGCMVFASILRLSQGIFAITVTLLLIVTTSTTIEIILNFTAINFISRLDNVGFEIVKWGKYGPKFEEEAKRIEKLPLPRCIYRKYKHVRYLCTIIPVGIIFASMICFMIILQENNNVWVTEVFRVQFQDDAQGLHIYSGCYGKNESAIDRYEGFRRKLYESFDINDESAKFGYCIDDRRWILFKGDITNGCDAGNDNALARSTKTDTFDVSTMFEEPWYSSSNTPLDLYFVEENGDIELNNNTCSSFLNDGNCDSVFNNFDYQYDGGDCCAATCSGSNCGTGSLKNAFGITNMSGDGFPNCKDPTMVPITIRLDNILSSYEPQFNYSTGVAYLIPDGSSKNSTTDDNFPDNPSDDDCLIEWLTKDTVKPLLFINCDGNKVLNIYVDEPMENQTETIMVNDGADCTMTIRNDSGSFDPIWYADYTIFHGDKKSVESNSIVVAESSSAKESTSNFKRIPECYLDELSDHIDNSIVYAGIGYTPTANAIDWLMNDESGNSKCENSFFLERYALAVIHFATTSNSSDYSLIGTTRQCGWPSILCDEGTVVNLDMSK
jgi:hypothetical protein